MARLPRIILPGQPHHIVQRGHNREPVFFAEEDYLAFLEFLKTAAGRYGCAIHAYVLMTNHYHILATPPDAAALPSMIQMLGRLYVRHVNKEYRRSGTLWEGRYKTSLIDAEDYLFACMRYIENNPVRAKMTRKPSTYEWSSYRRNAEGKADSLILSHELYVRLGATSEQRRRAYEKLFARVDDEEFVGELRQASGGFAVGSAKFHAKVERMLERRTAPMQRGGDRRSEKFREGAA